ncbi:outer membrane protein, cobalt-zinc-cadmium efflux system [Duganella sacchari]|uniref:Outer membrane protein, cobalt-zinc-cadmium efflux system n=1 Tax=Duganella sacchari TaxID=551987 RepID=A0A1M7MZU3_9BURK|nr:TolC family protein [Duganella sacchari]SHM96768.1 outer membrane protein, cobalt-zinc-cadmium efflux system [Duganella sacchari]
MYKFVLPLWLAAWPAYAQAGIEPPAPLTLPAALALADSANADLAAARHELSAEDGVVQQAGLLPNPSLTVERVDTRRDTRETTVQLSQPLELGGKRSARVQAAQRGREGAAAALVQRRAEVHSETTAAWFAVLAAQEQLRLAQKASELAQRAAAATGRRVVAGKVSPVEETRAQVAASTVKLDLIRAQSALVTARARLASMWGNPAPVFEKVAGEIEALPELAPLPAQRALLAQAPAMQVARSEVERRQALAKVELSRRVPDVSVNIGSKRSEELGRTQAVFGISVPLPLFDRNQGAVLETARRADKARDELTATAARLEAELAQAREEYAASRAQALALRSEILPGAQSAYDAAITGFDYGKFGFLDVLDAQRTLLQAQSHYLTTLADAHRAQAAIARILGADHE